MAFISSKGTEYRNLDEQVKYLSEVVGGQRVEKIESDNFNVGDLNVSNTATIKGDFALTGTAEFGNNVEVDGDLIVNAPEDIKFKEDNTTLKDKLDKKANKEDMPVASSTYQHTMTIFISKESNFISVTTTFYNLDPSPINTPAILLSTLKNTTLQVSGICVSAYLSPTGDGYKTVIYPQMIKVGNSSDFADTAIIGKGFIDNNITGTSSPTDYNFELQSYLSYMQITDSVTTL